MPSQQHPPYQGLYAWGSSTTYYNLGNLENNTYNSPVMVINETPVSWRSISTGGIANANGAFTAAVDEKYRLWMWGNNDSYQFPGGGTPIDGISYPGLALGPAEQLTASELANYSWKSISVNDGYTQHIPLTGASSMSTSFTLAAVAATYILAIRSDGRLFSWGANPYYTLGQGAVRFKNKPTEVSGGGSWNLAVAGTYSALGIKSDGRLYRWGSITDNPDKFNETIASVPTLVTTNTSTTYNARYVSTGIGTSSPVFASSLSYTHGGIYPGIGHAYVTGPYLNLARTEYTRTIFHTGRYKIGSAYWGYYTTSQQANYQAVGGSNSTIVSLERLHPDASNIPDDNTSPTFAGPFMSRAGGAGYYFACLGRLYGQGYEGTSNLYTLGQQVSIAISPVMIANWPSAISAIGVSAFGSSGGYLVLGKDGYVYAGGPASQILEGSFKNTNSFHVIGTSTDVAGLSYAVTGTYSMGSIVMATAPWGATAGRSAVGIVKGNSGNRVMIQLDDNSLYAIGAGYYNVPETGTDGALSSTYATSSILPGSAYNPWKVQSFVQMAGAGGQVILPTGSFGGHFFQNSSTSPVLSGPNWFYLSNYKVYGGGGGNSAGTRGGDNYYIETYNGYSVPANGARLNYDFSATGNMYQQTGSYTMVSCGASYATAINTDFRLREWGTFVLPSGTSANAPQSAYTDAALSPNLVVSVSAGADHGIALVAPSSTAANIIRLLGSKVDATSTVAMTDTTGVVAGQRIYGDGVPDQTFVKSVTANSQIAVTNNVAGTDPTVNLTFVPGVNSMYHWGNVYGNGTLVSPTLLSAGSWIFVDAGYKTSAGISASTTLPAGSGRLFMWGQNTNYQLGNGNNTAKLSIGTALGTSTWRKISIAKISPTNVLGILNNYTLRSWGYHGQTSLATGIAPTVVNLGFDITSGSSSIYGGSVTGLIVGMAVTGTGIQAGTVINSIDAVNFIVLLSLSATSTISGAGLIFTGGVTSATVHVSTPTAIGGEYWKDVKATGYGGYGIQTSVQGAQKGTLWSWGGNAYSELGSGVYGDQSARVYELPNLAIGKEGAQIGLEVYNQATKSYYLVNGSSAISTADTSGIVSGQSVTGTGIASGTTVVDVEDSTSITLSNNAEYSGLVSGVSFWSVTGTSRSNWTLVGGGVTTRTATSEIIYS